MSLGAIERVLAAALALRWNVSDGYGRESAVIVERESWEQFRRALSVASDRTMAGSEALPHPDAHDDVQTLLGGWVAGFLAAGGSLTDAISHLPLQNDEGPPPEGRPCRAR